MRLGVLSVSAALCLALCTPAFAQHPRGTVIIPDSSIERASDIGKRFHTNIRVFVPEESFKSPEPLGPPFPFFFETPASIACDYHLVTPVVGCNPLTVTKNPT